VRDAVTEPGAMTDRTVLVTGGTGGIGKATATGLTGIATGASTREDDT
jgi:NAD(P)-dependent dehydrogenase (short-subunit alcohol dehydrogenase family)